MIYFTPQQISIKTLKTLRNTAHRSENKLRVEESEPTIITYKGYPLTTRVQILHEIHNTESFRGYATWLKQHRSYD